MVSCLGDVKLWTLRNQAIVPDNSTGLFTYHEKVEESDLAYPQEKGSYCESQDSTWVLKNRRPDKMRDSLKEMEELFQGQSCVSCRWMNRTFLQMFLTSGTVVTLEVSLHTGDVDKIAIDKSLTGKLSGDTVNDVTLTDIFMVMTYADRAKLDLIYFQRRLPSPYNIKKLEKLTAFDPKISQIEIPGPGGRRLDRRVICSPHKDMVLVWWSTASDEAWPWAPMTSDRDKANMVLLSVNGFSLELSSFLRTDGDPFHVCFSEQYQDQIFTVEQGSVNGGEHSVDICNYDIVKGKLTRTSVTTMVLSSRVTACEWSHREDYVLIGCADGKLVMFDEYKRSTTTAHTSMKPAFIRWHPSDTLVVVASQQGELQVYDLALSSVNFQLLGESCNPKKLFDLSRIFRSAPGLQLMKWQPAPSTSDIQTHCMDSLLLVFDQGPVGVIQFQQGVLCQGHLTVGQLVCFYLKHQQVQQAVSLMSALNWNQDGHLCFSCLSYIMNCLLRQPLTPVNEAHLETALGTFYAPDRPLVEVTVLEFRDPISRLARCFFHHLLRYSRFDKAYLLAVDLGARDLFMDIHYVAKDSGEMALAEVAKEKADEIEAERVGPGGVNGFEPDVMSEEEEYEEGLVDPHGVDRPPRMIPSYHHPGWSRGLLNQPDSDGSLTGVRPYRGMGRFAQQAQSYLGTADITLAQLEDQLAAQFVDSDFSRVIEHRSVSSDGTRSEDNQEQDVQVIHFAMV